MRIRNGFEEFFCLLSNLSSDNIISSYRPGVKTGMDFKGLVWKQVLKITLFGLKSGQYLENWAAHPHQEFPGVPPRFPVVLPISKQTSSVILLLSYMCANCLGIDVKVTFPSFICLLSLFHISTVFLFFLTVEALVSNLFGNSKKIWSLARMSSRKRHKKMEGGLLQELTRASETYQ